MSECNCGERFRTAEDYRDHLPCTSILEAEPAPKAKVSVRDDGVHFSIGQQGFGPIVDTYLEGEPPEEVTRHREFIADALRTALGKLTEVTP